MRGLDHRHARTADAILGIRGKGGATGRIGTVGRAAHHGGRIDLDLGQLARQQFGGRRLAHAQHEQVVEVADDLAGLGPVADARLDVGERLRVGGDLHTGAAALVDHRDEFIAHEFVEFVGMDVDRHLRARRRTGQSVIDAEFIDMPSDGDQIREHRIPDGRGHLRIGERVQADIDHRALADDLHPIENRTRVVEIGVVRGEQLCDLAGGELFQQGQERGDDLVEIGTVVADGRTEAIQNRIVNAGLREIVFEGNRRVVLAADRAARKAGLAIGVPVAKAQALLPGLTVLDARPDEDRAALERLALWLQQRITPIVAIEGADGLVLDTTGADHLHGGEAVMLRDIVRRLLGAGITACTAVADTLGAAHAVARTTRGTAIIIPPGGHAEALADLPVASLRLPAETVAGLTDLGLTRIRDLTNAPRAPLALRFGETLAHRLDQVYGRLDEPILPIRPVDPVVVSRNFAEPIAAAETIARYIGKLVPPLCTALEERGLGARRLDLLLHRVDSRMEAVRIAMAAPVRDTTRLIRLLCERIETIDPGFGIERMELVAVLAEPMERRQTVSSLIEEPSADLSGLMDTLANRLGGAALYRVIPVESDVPERSVQRVPPLAPTTDAAWPEGWPRPTRLLPRPEPIETMAMLPDHPPVFFVWRGIRRKVKCADGPERVFGEWWQGDAELTAARDYFRVEDTSGERFWIYRAGDGEHGETGSQRWFLHGLFA